MADLARDLFDKLRLSPSLDYDLLGLPEFDTGEYETRVRNRCCSKKGTPASGSNGVVMTDCDRAQTSREIIRDPARSCW
ncbi:MAG: hypothetical protein AB1486_07225 [Planctomycetota bacterium]